MAPGASNDPSNKADDLPDQDDGHGDKDDQESEAARAFSLFASALLVAVVEWLTQ